MKRVRIQRNTNVTTNTNAAGATNSTAAATNTTAAGATNSTATATATSTAFRVNDARNPFETFAFATASSIGAITNAVTTRVADEFHRITYGRSQRLETSNNNVTTTAAAAVTTAFPIVNTPTTTRPVVESQQLTPTKRVRVRESARQHEARALLNSTIHPGESPYFNRNQRARIFRRQQEMESLNTNESPQSESHEGARTRETSRTQSEGNQPKSPIQDSGESRQPERSIRVRFQVTPPPPLPPSPVNRNRASLRQRSRPGARKD